MTQSACESECFTAPAPEETDIRESGRPLLSALDRWPDDQSAVLDVIRSILAEETVC